MFIYFRAFGIAAIMSGCASVTGLPESSLDPNRDIAKTIIDQTLGEANLKTLAVKSNITNIERNKVIQARIAEIDILYYRYESRISNDVRSGNFGFSLAGILIGGIGSFASGGTSKELSAVSAALVGGKSSFDKDVLLDQSLGAFASQMRANRAAVKAKIVSRYSSDTDKYTLQMALGDLAEYQQAGTLAAALAGITQSAQESEAENAGKLAIEENKIIEDRKPSNVSSGIVDLAKWIDAAGSPAEVKTRRDASRECFNSADRSSITDSNDSDFFGFISNSKKYPTVEAQIMNCLIAKKLRT